MIDPADSGEPSAVGEARFDRLARLARAALGVPIAYVALDGQRQQLLGHCGGVAAKLDGVPREQTFCQFTLAADRPLVVPDTLLDERFASLPLVKDPPRLRFYAGHPVRDEGGRAVGTLCCADTRPRDEAVARPEVMAELAELAGRELALTDLVEAQRQTLEARAKLAEQVEDARRYVLGLLPQNPETAGALAGVEADWHFEPHDQLGGDLFNVDAFAAPDGAACMAYVIDVMGHGVGASLHAASIRHALDRLLRRLPPGEALAEVDCRFPMDLAGGRFFTSFCCTYEPRSRVLRYAGMGHPPALLVGRDGVERLASDAPPGGTGLGSPATQERRVEPGERLWCYSDGVVESRTQSGQLLGIAGLADLLARTDGGVAASELRRQLRSLQAGPLDDDLTLMSLTFA